MILIFQKLRPPRIITRSSVRLHDAIKKKLKKEIYICMYMFVWRKKNISTSLEVPKTKNDLEWMCISGKKNHSFRILQIHRYHSCCYFGKKNFLHRYNPRKYLSGALFKWRLPYTHTQYGCVYVCVRACVCTIMIGER